MKKKKQKYIVILLIITLLSLTFGIKYLNKSKYEEISEVRLREKIEKEKTFAIMIQENSANDKYQEYKGNTWPGDDYKFKEAKCIDNSGNEIKEAVSYKEGKITLTTNKTIYCTIYFDKSIIGKIRENDPNKVLSVEKVGGMYRYQGVGTEEEIDDTHKLVDNNYVCFGTNDINKCNCNTEENCDKYMYRIIGITKDGKLYLIKMKGVELENAKTFAWNLKWQSSDCLNNSCEWPNVDIYKRLNGEKSNGNPIFINNSRYDYMTEENDWYKKIEKHNWLYGDIDYTISNTMLDGEMVYGAQNNGLVLYDIETGVKPVQHYEQIDGSYELVKYQWSEEKNADAKIGLMYLNEYSLAYDNERNLYNDYDTSNWLFVDNNNNTTGLSIEWLISRRGPNSNGFYTAWNVLSDGTIQPNALNASYVVRPVFYLSPTIRIKNGIGTKTNPFILEI